MAKFDIRVDLDTDKRTGKIRRLKDDSYRFSIVLLDEDGDAVLSMRGYRSPAMLGRVVPPSLHSVKGTLYLSDMSRGLEDKILRMIQDMSKKEKQDDERPRRVS